jgi:aldose 1-epimerase
MELYVCALALLAVIGSILAPRAGAQTAAGKSAPRQVPAAVEIGGEKVVTLTRKAFSTAKPEFTSVTILPGRGMEIQQITAHFPGKGRVDVLASPDLAASKKMLEEQDDENGDASYRLGSAFLVPYPNRIRGTLSADGKTLTTAWQGHTLTLPANNAGHSPNAERHAMHGLILKAKAENVKVTNIVGGEEATAVIHAGDFGGHWLSKTDLTFTILMTGEAVTVTVVARNAGADPEPMAMGWHPYFAIPSGDRVQARLQIPAAQVAEIDNYDNVFPTGKLKPVDGTQFDLRAPNGVPLTFNYYDDNWSNLDWKNGAATVKLFDPAAHYGVAIDALSPEIKTIQAYALPTRKVVAIEDQYNFADPFGKEWNGMDTGMVTLKPGQSTKWQVRLRLFVPQ